MSSLLRPKLSMSVPTPEPWRVVFTAVEGFGKSTLASYAEKPAILMSRGETGYRTLLAHGLAPAVQAVELTEWQHTIDTIAELTEDSQGIKTLCLDALSGFTDQCIKYVCNRDFNGDFGEKGFSSYQRGYGIAAAEWIKLLVALDALRLKQNVKILILSHVQITPFKNPEGADFDRYTPDIHAKLWSPTFKWSDATFFGRYITVIDQENQKKTKGKGIGGTERVVYTQRRDAYDAKNRYAMPEGIDISNDPSLMFNEIFSHITK